MSDSGKEKQTIEFYYAKTEEWV